MLMEFMLDGWSYTQKTRTCNKENCKCHDGQPHGPYWYRTRDGRLEYVGKNLPEGTETRYCNIRNHDEAFKRELKDLKTQLEILYSQAAEIRNKMNVLEQLSKGQYISEKERDFLYQLGFDDMLPPQILQGKQADLL